jgi:uncharacterized protein (TIGR02453 family)
VWPPEALDFLRDLEANNDRDWFKANRDRYDAHVLEPARALAETLSDLGEPHYFRPYNDLRFHQRPPIKEQLGVALGYGPAGGYYFELSLDGLIVAAGLHRPASDQLDRFRAAIDDGRRAAAFSRAVDSARSRRLKLTEPGLKRAPRGYPLDHPRIDLLRLTEITVSKRHHPLKRWLHTRECDRRVRDELESAQPLVAWLADEVGPSQAARRTRG